VKARQDAAAVLAAEVAGAARRAGSVRTLLLDLDGTLAPIAATPRDARVPARTLELLGRLVHTGWSVAVVSGRPAAELRSMVPVRGVRIFGSHGLEGLQGHGSSRRAGGARSERLSALAARAASLAGGFPGALVELKPAGIAFHDRAVAPEDLAAWRKCVRDLLGTSDLEGFEELSGRRVLEIRPRGLHKGQVVSAVLGKRARGGRDASLVAIGDDGTDEDLFGALAGRGLAVRVGRVRRGTLAVRRLPSAKAVQRFLEELVRASEIEGRRERRRGPA
jgi:trehalose 6-phosphate phosphatase